MPTASITTATDQHVLVATANGPTGLVYVRLDAPTSYDQALDAWHTLVDHAREGRLVIHLDGDTVQRTPRWARVNHVAVRSADDPLYRTVADSRLLVSPKGWADRTGACKAWGHRHGYVARAGGWVYRNGRTVCQGWESLVSRYSAAVVYLDGRWFVTEAAL